MNDLIDRQKAIEAVRYKICDYIPILWGKQQEIPLEIEMVLVRLPSAEPKHGHWVYKDGVRGFGIGAWCCSECGEENESLPFHKCHDPYAYVASKYCPACGAKMEADHDSD